MARKAELDRKVKMDTLYKVISEQPEVDKEHIIAYCSLQFGSARRKALEYISTLIHMNLIDETKDVDGKKYLVAKVRKDRTPISNDNSEIDRILDLQNEDGEENGN